MRENDQRDINYLFYGRSGTFNSQKLLWTLFTFTTRMTYNFWSIMHYNPIILLRYPIVLYYNTETALCHNVPQEQRPLCVKRLKLSLQLVQRDHMLPQTYLTHPL
jgi:hypothetical protein